MKVEGCFRCLSVWYSRDLSSCRRVLVRPWPRADVFCVYPRSGSSFVVVDVHSNSLYVAEYKKLKNGRFSNVVDFDDLRLICFDADDSHYALVREAYSDYLADCAFNRMPGCEHRFASPENCPVWL